MKLKIDFSFGVQYRGNGDALLGHEQAAGISKIKTRATELFGGHTQTNTLVEWRDPDVKITVAEEGITISVLENEDSDVVDDITRMVQQIKDSLQQKSVAVTRTEVEFDLL